MTNPLLAFLSLPGGAEWIVILVIAVLIFGRRLPDIARGIGKSITKFKKGIKDVDTTSNRPTPPKKGRSTSLEQFHISYSVLGM